jgi:hypothetical protein
MLLGEPECNPNGWFCCVLLADRSLAARSSALPTLQVEASKQQLLQLQGLVEAATAAQDGYSHAVHKVGRQSRCLRCGCRAVAGVILVILQTQLCRLACSHAGAEHSAGPIPWQACALGLHRLLCCPVLTWLFKPWACMQANSKAERLQGRLKRSTLHVATLTQEMAAVKLQREVLEQQASPDTPLCPCA